MSSSKCQIAHHQQHLGLEAVNGERLFEHFKRLVADADLGQDIGHRDQQIEILRVAVPGGDNIFGGLLVVARGNVFLGALQVLAQFMR